MPSRLVDIAILGDVFFARLCTQILMKASRRTLVMIVTSEICWIMPGRIRLHEIYQVTSDGARFAYVALEYIKTMLE